MNDVAGSRRSRIFKADRPEGQTKTRALTMNRKSRSLPLLAAAGTLVLLGACATSRSLDQSFDDLGANAKLKEVLLTDRSYDYGDVDLTIFEGRLLLSGTMRSEAGREKLLANAWKAGGVKQVIDEVYVGDKTPFGQGLEDGRIDAALRAKLIADDDVKSSDVKIAVSNGVVFLLGVTRDQQSLDRLLTLARNTGGVTKVVSHVLFADAPERRL